VWLLLTWGDVAQYCCWSMAISCLFGVTVAYRYIYRQILAADCLAGWWSLCVGATQWHPSKQPSVPAKCNLPNALFSGTLWASSFPRIGWQSHTLTWQWLSWWRKSWEVP